ncbi:MAG: hypothetical protein IPN16_19000 [Gemmatimonadetes bacterium]|nr:hypothetical protein [Gemmatimonadota bacterium]
MNVDETTYMFSPKVLDRANVIEFRVDESDMHRFVQAAKPVRMEAMDGVGARFGDCLLSFAREDIKLATEIEESARDELLVFFRVMAAHGVDSDIELPTNHCDSSTTSTVAAPKKGLSSERQTRLWIA